MSIPNARRFNPFTLAPIDSGQDSISDRTANSSVYYGEIKTDVQRQEQTCDEDNFTSPKEKGCHCVLGIVRS